MFESLKTLVWVKHLLESLAFASLTTLVAEVLWLTHLSWFNQPAELWCVLTRGRVSSVSGWRQNYPGLWIRINYCLNSPVPQFTHREDPRSEARSLYKEVGSRAAWPGVSPRGDTPQEEPPLLSATHSWRFSSSPRGHRRPSTEMANFALFLLSPASLGCVILLKYSVFSGQK